MWTFCRKGTENNNSKLSPCKYLLKPEIKRKKNRWSQMTAEAVQSSRNSNMVYIDKDKHKLIVYL